jgi:hypothetical protein
MGASRSTVFRQRQRWLGGGGGKAQLLPPIQDDASADILIPAKIGGLGDEIHPANERVGRQQVRLPLGRRVALN